MKDVRRPESGDRRRRCLVRVAAGPRLGFGHLMRARALAKQLDADVAISVRGGAAAQQTVRALGFGSAAGIGALRRTDLLVVDDPHFEHGRRWIAHARRLGVRCVSVHDGPRAHQADLVVCGSLDAAAPRTTARTLRGARFYLLDANGTRTRRAWSVRPSAPRVLVALGGGRHVRDVAQPLIDAIRQRVPAAVVRVAPGFSPKRCPRLRGGRWLVRHAGLSAALANADVAIVAGGVTLYEACALGVPSVGLAVVREQRPAVRAFARRGAVLDAGGLATAPGAIRAAAASVARLLTDEGLRRAMGRRASRLVDGRGAERVARCMGALLDAGGSPRA